MGWGSPVQSLVSQEAVSSTLPRKEEEERDTEEGESKTGLSLDGGAAGSTMGLQKAAQLPPMGVSATRGQLDRRWS